MKTLLVVLIFTNVAQVFCTLKRGCPKLTPVPIDENFVKSKFIITRHSGTEIFRKVDKKFEFMGKPVDIKSVCWDFSGVLEDGSEYKIKVKCDYYTISRQYCTIEKEAKDKFLSTKGTITYTSTDNSTYVAGVTCVGAKGAFWFIATKSGEIVDADVEESAFEIFDKAGLDTVNVANKESPVIFKEFTQIDEKECQ